MELGLFIVQVTYGEWKVNEDANTVLFNYKIGRKKKTERKMKRMLKLWMKRRVEVSLCS